MNPPDLKVPDTLQMIWMDERARHTGWLRSDITQLEKLLAGAASFHGSYLVRRLRSQQAELREMMGLPPLPEAK